MLERSNSLAFSDMKGASSLWSAHRIRAENENKFDAIEAAKGSRPVLFTGEVRHNVDVFS